MDDLLAEFLTESNEGLQVLDNELVKLEQNPNDPELLSNIFRLMHTIKGTCGFLGLPRLEGVAHAGENVLGRLRDGEITVSPEIVSLILECLDRIREILAALEATESEPEGDDADLIARLNAAAEGKASAPEAPAADEPAPEPVEMVSEEESQPGDASEPEAVETEAAAEATVEAAPESEAPVEPTPETPEAPKPAASDAPPAPAAKAEAKATKESAVANQSIRVNVDLLEDLMTMVSELVLTRNQLLQILRTQKESEFGGPLQRLNHVVSELQEGVMKTRMQPIGNAWAKLPRLVRDLSHELGKKIELEMRGADTELDRQVLDLIKDPLTHMVRNSADHGLERTEDRVSTGKSETGTIVLEAYHEGGQIIIKISDDGRGINVDRVKEKAIVNGLATEAEMEMLSDQQINQFIFKPGFSTAEAVTAVSGRGVGMDVVRTNIEKIGGTIELTSTQGEGSCFTIKIPLTLAIVSALIVACAGERFAIPQLSVVELVRASGASEHSIERIQDTPVLRLRDRLLPLVHLRDLLHLENDFTELTEEQEDVRRDDFIVVTQVANYSFGIIVDRVFDTEEIVVKPVAPILREISLFSGNTILGDGSVVMILDPNGIASVTGEINVTDKAEEDAQQEVAHAEDRVAMLLFRAEGNTPKAVPLSLVARLEEVDLAQVEASGDQRVVQYRGQLMPLFTMEGSEEPTSESGRRPVLVFSEQGRNLGLMVNEIVDIIETPLNVELSGESDGFVGSAIINDAATEVIDVGYYVNLAFDDWFGAGRQATADAGNGRRVLLVDDSAFFRNLLSPLLDVAGYQVTTVESAVEALQLCEEGRDFDVIISDIEMPGMSGYDLCEALKTKRWAETPIVALSAHSSPGDIARGREVGFADYVAKFDRDALLSSLDQTIAEVRGAA